MAPDGSVRWFEELGQYFPATEDRPARIVGVIFDVSERRRVEEAFAIHQESDRLRDGDSIEVGEKTTGGWAKIASIIGVVTSLAWAISYVARR